VTGPETGPGVRLGELTPHAAVRMQQRGIRPEVLACVLEFGAVLHDHRGGRIVYLDRRGCRHAVRAGAARRPDAETWRGVYVVLGRDGRVATVGRRYKRIRRP
jgi:hypothetical protein